MKRYIDLPYVICLLIVIGGGIYLNKLAKNNALLRRENENMKVLIEHQRCYIKDLQNLYIQNLLPRDETDIPPGVLCFRWRFDAENEMSDDVLIQILNMFDGIPSDKLCLYFSEELGEELKSLLRMNNLHYQIDKKITSSVLFYKDLSGWIKGYLRINRYTLNLMEQYMKIIRVHYMLSGE